jgi:hypothetical protein
MNLQLPIEAKIDRESIVIGKDILELLSHAMYLNPLSVYREYIQNSTDSIDEAENTKAYNNHLTPRIDISISQTDRTVKILDNGIGLKKQNFKKRITAFGASKKRGSEARGFRGVGRLAGLGYCQELIFRTRAAGETEISEVVWDCRKILELLRDDSFKGDLKDVVNYVTEFNKPNLPSYPDHFFEVEMRKLSRLKNDILLNELEIKNYLSQVAPVPFSPNFKHKEQIEIFLSKYNLGKSFDIFLNNSNDPIYRPHQNTLKISDNLIDKFKPPVFYEITGTNGHISAIGWRLDHSYFGAIPNTSYVKGLRVRAGNIQVGNEHLLSDLFSEKRFNSWAVGEIHILDKKIKPNGRRDNFPQSQSYSDLLNQLNIQAQAITKLCREQSVIRNRAKSFEIEKRKIEERLSLLTQSVIPRNLETSLKKEVRSSIATLGKLSNSIGLFGDETPELKKEFEQTQANADKILNNKITDDPLANVASNKKSAYKEIFGLIYECSSNRIVAKTLIDKIIIRISGMN